ncbi:MAG: hypothetical protein ACRD4I_13175, partial [Candidatus Angelobacter sp.]
MHCGRFSSSRLRSIAAAVHGRELPRARSHVEAARLHGRELSCRRFIVGGRDGTTRFFHGRFQRSQHLRPAVVPVCRIFGQPFEHHAGNGFRHPAIRYMERMRIGITDRAVHLTQMLARKRAAGGEELVK